MIVNKLYNEKGLLVNTIKKGNIAIIDNKVGIKLEQPINKTIDKLYVSTEWRSKCGIKTGPNIHRDQLKSAAIALVKDKYGVFANDDICDAICIGMSTFMETPPKPPKKNPTVTENGFVFG